jgi:lantibiotic biosynthesis protein
MNKPHIHAKIHDIAQCLAAQHYKYDSSSLMTGTVGIALFDLYYAKYCCNEAIGQEKISMTIDSVVNCIEGTPQMRTSFCSGLSGIGWFFEHIQKIEFVEMDTSDFLKDIDPHITDFIQDSYKRGDYDFLHGGNGAVWYYFHKISPPTPKFIENIYQYLHTTAEYTPNGAKWKSILSLTTMEQGYNIGLSHGSSSIVTLLCKMYQCHPSNQILSLLKATVDFIIHQKRESPPLFGSFFPTYSIEDDKKLGINGSRLAWCYGDLGIGIALWQAAKVLSDKELENIVLDIFIHNAKRRSFDNSGVQDAGLCHGSAGIAAIYYRMYQNTGQKIFLETTDFWIEQILHFSKNMDDYAGYKVWRPDEAATLQVNHSLLEGIAGIGLMLITYLHEIPPTWDELLMLS